MVKKDKETKKAIKECKKQIKKRNIAVRGYMKTNKYRKGSYGTLQHTNIWKKAKENLLEYYRLMNIPLLCPYCNKEIKDKPILHHIKYNWEALFTPNNIIFLHYTCHNKLHDDLKDKKKRKWKKGIKKFDHAY